MQILLLLIWFRVDHNHDRHQICVINSCDISMDSKFKLILLRFMCQLNLNEKWALSPVKQFGLKIKDNLSDWIDFRPFCGLVSLSTAVNQWTQPVKLMLIDDGVDVTIDNQDQPIPGIKLTVVSVYSMKRRIYWNSVLSCLFNYVKTETVCELRTLPENVMLWTLRHLLRNRDKLLRLWARTLFWHICQRPKYVNK